MSGSDSDDDFGPMLPPGFEKEAPAPTSRAVIGPTLPPGFATSTSSPTDLIAPLGEDPEEDSSDDDVIGPLLPGQEIDRGYGKITRVRKDDKEKREEWMTVIPDKVEKKLGLKSVTSFCKKGSTTDDLRPKVVSKKDQELTEVLSDYTKSKRAASLLDMHQDKSKKKKTNESEKPKVRQPLEFNPEEDLHVKNFDEKQTKSVIDKSKLLNTRFSAGSSKFL